MLYVVSPLRPFLQNKGGRDPYISDGKEVAEGDLVYAPGSGWSDQQYKVYIPLLFLSGIPDEILTNSQSISPPAQTYRKYKPLL